ncbi:MAG: class III signal peptide-containing protein [Candidatus Micrarchaeia archaeon]
MDRSKKGQLSAEMLILLAVLLAVAAIVAMQLLNTANTASQKTGAAANATFESIDQFSDCTQNPAGCPLGMTCDQNTHRCV